MARSRTRREFLKRSGVAAAGLWAGCVPALGAGRSAGSPNEKLGIAVVGVAGRGKANLLAVRSQRIVALCDVDERLAAEPRKWIPKAKFYTDFRRVFDQKDVDAVVVSTPDHTHAPATAMALRAGKHVYCEKPLTHSVYEARQVTELAAKQKCATQMGIQIHAGKNYRRVVELIRAGTIGPVTEVHVWCNGGYAPGDRPKGRPPVPAGLHYDAWLGPAPHRPYHPDYLPGKWRGWWDFGSGRLGDMACHVMDLAHWALDLRHVRAVQAEGPPVHPESTPAWLIVRYEYPARKGKPPVTLTWYNGHKRPAAVAKGRFSGWKTGVLFVGKDGRLLADYDRHVVMPEEKHAAVKRESLAVVSLMGHHSDWIRACKTGRKAACSFEYAGPLTETVLLGNVAYRSGKRIAWDAKTLRIASAPEAMKYLRREYRKGWAL